MKANELMIRDWVMTPNGIARVIMIGEHSPCYTNKTGEGEAAIFPRDLQPIPLTPEILEKNGFEKSEYGWYCNRKIDDWEIKIYIGRIETFVKIDKGVYPHINNTDCRFLHQLQHALRSCGIEKEITI